MGGRGISVHNSNGQIKLEQFLLRQRIEEIRAAHSRMQKESRESPDSAVGAGTGGQFATGRILLKRCACCRRFTLPAYTEYEVCSICGWIDDPQQNADITLEQGENPVCLKEAREAWRIKCSGES